MRVHVVAFGVAHGPFELTSAKHTLRNVVFPRLEEAHPDEMQSRKRIAVSHNQATEPNRIQRGKEISPAATAAALAKAGVHDGDVIIVEHGD